MKPVAALASIGTAAKLRAPPPARVDAAVARRAAARQRGADDARRRARRGTAASCRPPHRGSRVEARSRVAAIETGLVAETDIRRPGPFDGWRIAEIARTRGPGTRIIDATSLTTDTTRPTPGRLFFTKPYRPSAIVAAMRSL